MSRNKEQGASQRHKGPQIIVRSPQEGARITAPFELDIQFMSAKGAAIDLDSLRVHFRKVWNIDITDYVRLQRAECILCSGLISRCSVFLSSHAAYRNWSERVEVNEGHRSRPYIGRWLS
jgi:hypothetical protein